MRSNGKNIEELTRIEAYLLSEKAGHPSHLHNYFWTQAEAIVRQRAAVVEVAVKATAKAAAKSAKAKPATLKTPAAKTPGKKPDPQLLLGEKPTPAKIQAKKIVPAAAKVSAKKGKSASKSK